MQKEFIVVSLGKTETVTVAISAIAFVSEAPNNTALIYMKQSVASGEAYKIQTTTTYQSISAVLKEYGTKID